MTTTAPKSRPRHADDTPHARRRRRSWLDGRNDLPVPAPVVAVTLPGFAIVCLLLASTGWPGMIAVIAIIAAVHIYVLRAASWPPPPIPTPEPSATASQPSEH